MASRVRRCGPGRRPADSSSASDSSTSWTSASRRSVRGSISAATRNVLRRASTASRALDTVSWSPTYPARAVDSASFHTVLRKDEVSRYSTSVALLVTHLLQHLALRAGSGGCRWWRRVFLRPAAAGPHLAGRYQPLEAARRFI